MRTRSLLCRRMFVGVGVTFGWRTNASVVAEERGDGDVAIVGSSQKSTCLPENTYALRGLGWRGPPLRASGVSELRHWGAAGHTIWTPVVGLADQTSAPSSSCGISLVRSSRRQPSTTECPDGDDLPLGGVALSLILRDKTDARVNLEDCQLLKAKAL
jgi:hypothetical protein